jgi:hypothetical protein
MFQTLLPWLGLTRIYDLFLYIRAAFPTHLILLELINQPAVGEQCPLYCTAVHCTVLSPRLHLLPDIGLITLLLNTFSCCYSRNARDHVSHPYTTSNVAVLRI